ncbi:MAG TPA: hypothetical protein VD886_00290 [Herpetosiphonaceae bacterium]|nr:hypothetical protein [Herpetosiphonaceae bacterium]
MPDIDLSSDIDLSDVQGFILRGYRVEVARHFMLKVVDAGRARALLARLVSRDPDLPQLTTAAPWKVKPLVFLNVGLTASGLLALGLPPADVAKFPPSFQAGPTDPKIARRVGDVGSSAPEYWVGRLNDPASTHLVISIWAMSQQALEHGSAQLRVAFDPGLSEQSAHDAQALPRNKVHFNYTDSIAQPTIAGAPKRKHDLPDAQPEVATGAFLMGYPNQSKGIYAVSPDELTRNSSFAAFRILEQDSAGFEALLDDAARQTNLDRELVAAKMCGRWRNGVPLVLSPFDCSPEPPIPRHQINNFHYVDPDPAKDDTFGNKCPIGSHIRRTNPRDAAVVGGEGVGHKHRIVRRAMPYGPAYDPDQPADGHERGLVGWFINADLLNQFEFIMNSWVNRADFVRSVEGPDGDDPVNNISGQDPLLGINDTRTTTFTISAPAGNLEITGFKSLVTTRGGVYCYLPSVTALRYLASLPGSPPADGS